MTNPKNSDLDTNSVAQSKEDIEQNPGARTAEINSNPQQSLAETRNAAKGNKPNAAGGNASSTPEDHVPSSSDPEPSDLPTSR
jgi:hypothetical protein